MDTLAINKAIDAAAGAGGGTVYFAGGTYLCFSIRLKSKVELFLAMGSMIVAADPPAQKGGEGYDLVIRQNYRKRPVCAANGGRIFDRPPSTSAITDSVSDDAGLTLSRRS